MTIQELLAGGGGLVLLLLTLVQIAPVKINPWSALAKTVGKAVNADISSRLDGIEAKLDGHITMDDRRTADSRRAQILHFNNELLRPINHTKEEFVEVLAKIDDYERYCEEHPEYPNNRAVLAIENIREVYKERLKKRDFLQESHAKDEEGGRRMLNIKAKEVAPIVEQPADFSEEWPENIVEEPALDLPEPNKRKATTMKIIVWVCLINGIAWVWCSYILAWMGKEQIAESLSQVALTEIIGVVLVYAIKSGVENLSKNNSWPDKHGSTPSDGVG